MGGATIPVYLNLGIIGIDRVVRELRAAFTVENSKLL